jgi:hypothetical protein
MNVSQAINGGYFKKTGLKKAKAANTTRRLPYFDMGTYYFVLHG